jgi:archaeosortase A (PGF-CTERM-specific)
MEKKRSLENTTAVMFLILPTIFILLGLLFFPYPLTEFVTRILLVPLFGGLFFLGIGFILKEVQLAQKLKISGWMLFAFFWSTQPNSLYYGVDGDIFNAALCIIGVYVLCYLAYHEWLSLKRNERISCLDWTAGAAALAGFIYFIVELTPIAPWLIETVAIQSGWLLNLFIGNVEVYGVNIFCDDVFTVSIIFACTAIQSMVLFVGMILPLPKVDLKRKVYGLLVTIVPIYILNLVRNALIAYLVKDDPDFFYIAHNVIGKGGSLVALVILLFIVVKIVPEVFDEILCLTDLYKRKGPLEQMILQLGGRKK